MMREMMEEMQKMCKNMDKTNIPPFMKGMKIPNNEMMREICKTMEKKDSESYKSCREFMDRFMKK